MLISDGRSSQVDVKQESWKLVNKPADGNIACCSWVSNWLLQLLNWFTSWNWFSLKNAVATSEFIIWLSALHVTDWMRFSRKWDSFIKLSLFAVGKTVEFTKCRFSQLDEVGDPPIPWKSVLACSTKHVLSWSCRKHKRISTH